MRSDSAPIWKELIDSFEPGFAMSNLSRDLNRLENIGNYGIGRGTVEFRFGAQREPMSENRHRYVADVIGGREITAANGRQSLRTKQQGD